MGIRQGSSLRDALRPEAKSFYAKKFAKTNDAVATKAWAHKLARACDPMLKTVGMFDVKRCFAG